jgi:NADH:ubiquinone oxidoreductase subunit K
VAVTFCPHCKVPLTKDEERRARCPACKKRFADAPDADPEPDLADGDSFLPPPPRPTPARTVAVSVVAVFVIVMGALHAAVGVGLTLSLEQARQKAREPTRVVQSDGTVREYPPHGCAVAIADFCLPMFMVFTVGLAAVGLGLAVTGVGLWRRRRWARIAAFCWMCLMAQAYLPAVVASDNPYVMALGVFEIVFAVASCVVLYRNRAEFRITPAEADAD